MPIGPQHRKILDAAIDRREDRDCQAFLLRVAPPLIRTMFWAIFQNGPSKGGAEEALRYFDGNPQHPAILATVPVVEECERFMPGFGFWLQQTGYGDDVEMIKTFARWYELGVKREQFRARMHA